MFNIRYGKVFMIVALCLGLLLLSACGTEKNQTTSGNQGTPKPSKTKELKSVTIAAPTRILAFAPVYAAISKGYFEKEGVKVNLTSGGGGTLALATLISGDAQFTASPPNTLFTLLEKNQDILAVSAFNKNMPLQIVLSNQYVDKIGIKPNAPLKDRLAALKQAKIGVLNVGGAQEIYLKSQMVWGGFSANDVKVTLLGDQAATMVALKQGVIDATLFSPPFAQQAEAKDVGKTWINASEFKEFDNMDTQWLYGLRKWIEQNPDTTKSVVKGIAEGITFCREQPAEAAKAILPFFEGVPLETLEKSLVDLKFIFQGDGKMSEESWRKALQPLIDLSSVSKITKQFDLKEDVLWTNKYISK